MKHNRALHECPNTKNKKLPSIDHLEQIMDFMDADDFDVDMKGHRHRSYGHSHTSYEDERTWKAKTYKKII